MARIQSLTTIPSVSNTDVLAIEHNTGTGTYKIPISMLLSDVYTKSQAVAKADIVNNLTSTNTDKPLSANMGRALNDNLTVGSFSITPASGVSIDEGYSKIKYMHFVVCMNIRFSLDSALTGKTITLGTVPNGYRPNLSGAGKLGFFASDDANDVVGQVVMDKDGVLTFYRGHTTSTSKIRIQATYFRNA